MERITEEQARMSKHLKSPRRLHRRIMRRLLFYLGILGPGLIAANAGNDPGRIATWSGGTCGGELIWWLVALGSYQRVAKVWLAVTFVLLAYVFSGFLAKPNWGEVLAGRFIPTIPRQGAFILTLVGAVGTTISP